MLDKLFVISYKKNKLQITFHSPINLTKINKIFSLLFERLPFAMLEIKMTGNIRQ